MLAEMLFETLREIFLAKHSSWDHSKHIISEDPSSLKSQDKSSFLLVTDKWAIKIHS